MTNPDPDAVSYGSHGDPLPEGKLDLPELLEQPTDEEWAWARAFIADRYWQEAVTYRTTAPHEYTVREWRRGKRANAAFDRFVTLVRRFGYADYYYQTRHIYWHIDEHKYWTMGWPLDETTVINRAHLATPEPWRARSRPRDALAKVSSSGQGQTPDHR